MRALSLGILAGLLSACGSAVEKPAELLAVESKLPKQVDYNLHVKPILSDRCFACHGPDKNKQQAGLRLDTPDGAFMTLKSGKKAIVVGNLAQSEMYHRLVSTDPEVIMPTPESHLTLSADEKALLLRWIEQGAEYKPHWSLVAPTSPDVPQTDSRWVRNDIDRFVLKTLNDRRLTPAPEADRHTLIRRVSFDLTGLPPTPAEVRAFVADRSPDAYDKLVTRLLASPHYGEHMAAPWLDAARYSDTHGYQFDADRNTYPWRDWVVRAFNQNLSYDRFVTWQLAGDLLPNHDGKTPTTDQLLATGFNRLHPQNCEGGIIPEEYRTEYVIDRVGTFGKAFLSLSLECARCHDHKYDPISQKDFYQLYAFFNNNRESGLVPISGEASPTILLPTADAKRTLAFIDQQIATLNRDHQRQRDSQKAAFNAWLAKVRANSTAVNTLGQAVRGRFAFDQFDKTGQTNNQVRSGWNATNNGGDIVPGKRGKGIRLTGEASVAFHDSVGTFDRYQPFAVSLWINLLNKQARGPIFAKSNSFESGQRGYILELRPDHRLAFMLNHVSPGNSVEVHSREAVPPGQWAHLAVSYDGSGRAAGVRLFLNGKPLALEVVNDQLTKSILYAANKTNWYTGGLALGRESFINYGSGMAVDELSVYGRQLADLEVVTLADRPDVARLLNVPDNQLTAQQRTQLFDLYLKTQDPAQRQYANNLQALRARQSDLLTDQLEVMVMQERERPRTTHLLKRGVYDAPGEVVTPNTPAAVGTLPDRYPRNRLGLSQWLTSPDHPLFARVAANRFWYQCFGQGLVKTVDDFGNQGEQPSHPELLDYLARRFQNGWNVKALMRLIVSSATYRQASTTTPAQREADPDNQWLARGPQHRLSAEQIRDAALIASGLLTRRLGGPSVKPYQPDGLYESLSAQKNAHYVPSQGADLYRRSLYSYHRRTSPAPSQLVFDASERYSCIIKRQRTNTPLQALVTLNDPQYVEAARVLAQQLVQATTLRALPTLPDTVIDHLFERVTSRPARPTERTLLRQLYADERAHFSRNPLKARQLLTVGAYPVATPVANAELAALAIVCHTVLNLDEAITKR